jgi:hypothetical protein
MIDANSYFVRNFNTLGNACMAYATHVDAEMNGQNPKIISYRHVIYMLCKQTPGTLSKTAITDDLAATEARFQTDAMVQDLIAILYAMKGCANGKSIPPSLLPATTAASSEGTAASLRPLPGDSIAVQSASAPDTTAEIRAFIEQTARDPEYAEGLRGLQLEQAHWGTLPTVFNGWQLCGLTIEQITPRLLCVNPERYVKE